MTDDVCQHVDCVRDEPGILVERRVKGTELVKTYCWRHDPLEDPEVRDRFEEVGGDE